MNGRPCSSFITDAVKIVSRWCNAAGKIRIEEHIDLETYQALLGPKQKTVSLRIFNEGHRDVRIAIVKVVCHAAENPIQEKRKLKPRDGAAPEKNQYRHFWWK